MPIAFALWWRYYTTRENSSRLSLLFLFAVAGSLGFQLLWTLGGREILCFCEDEVTITKQMLFFRRSQRFPIREISEPFFVPGEHRGEDSVVPSGIGFDFYGKHYRFLDHLEEADLTHIVGIVRGAYPEITASWNKPRPNFGTDGITTLGLSR